MVRIPRVFQEFASEAYRKKIQSEPPMPAHQARMDPPREFLGGEWQGPIQTSTGMVRLKPTNLPWKSTIHVGCVGTIDGWYGITTWCCRFFFPFPLLTTILLSGGFLTWANFATAHKILDISRGLGSHGTFLLKRNPFPPTMQDFAANKALEPPVKI